MNPQKRYYPAFLNITGRKCAVIGGGSVALRKVETLLEYGAGITVISPFLVSELQQIGGEGWITIVEREFRDGDLAGFFLIVSATDKAEVNDMVYAEAERRGQLVNVVDDAGRSNFIVPSSLQRGDLTIAVSTAGRSPALARRIRTNLEDYFGPEYAELVQLVNDVRQQLLAEGAFVSPAKWQQVLNIEYLNNLLRDGRTEDAKTILLDNLREG